MSARYVLLRIPDEEQTRTFLEDTAAAVVDHGQPELLTPVKENYVAFQVVSVLREGTPEAIKTAIEVSYRQAHVLESRERADREQYARTLAGQRVADRIRQ